MASITKSSGTLFPLINQMKDQNQTVIEPKLKRTVGQRQDVRSGDGLTTIMSKVWGLLKKQDEYTKAATKEIKSQEKFRKESKDLMKKNNEVVLKALNALSKDATGLLSKILKTEDKSLKEQQNALEQQKLANEVKNDFAKEEKKETASSENKRHAEIVALLKKIADGSADDEKKPKKEKKSFFEQFTAFMGGKFKDLLVSAFGSILGKDFAKILVSGLGTALTSVVGPALKTIISEGIALALRHPLASIALALGSTAVALMNNEDEEIRKKGGEVAADAAKQRRIQETITGPLDSSVLGSEIMDAAEGKLNTTDVIKNEINKKNTQAFPSTVNVKPGAEAAGPAEQGTEALKQNLSNISGFNRITAVKDEYHKENAPNSKHNKGLAVDFTVDKKTPEAYAAAADEVRQKIRAVGLKDTGTNPDFTVIDEFKSGTAPHIHVQFRDKQAADSYLAKSGTAVQDSSQMASIQAPPTTGANQTATATPEEKEKPKFLPEIIKDFATMAQTEYKATEGLFTPEGSAVTPSKNLDQESKQNQKLKSSQNQTSNPPVSVTNITNTAMAGGAGGTSTNVALGPYSNDSTLYRNQQQIQRTAVV